MKCGDSRIFRASDGFPYGTFMNLLTNLFRDSFSLLPKTDWYYIPKTVFTNVG